MLKIDKGQVERPKPKTIFVNMHLGNDLDLPEFYL